MINVEKRAVSRTGITSFGWQLGYGFGKEKVTIKSEVWCVIDGRDVLAECRSRLKQKGLRKH